MEKRAGQVMYWICGFVAAAIISVVPCHSWWFGSIVGVLSLLVADFVTAITKISRWGE